LDQVLLANDGTTTTIGQPYLKGAQVLCEILEHKKGPKVITYKFRRRENFRRTRGHRQSLTRLLVKDISLKGV
jgi:large subunit ribosomal protein L21